MGRNNDEEGVDVKGERGGDTGNTKQVGKGPQAEKGDARRDEHNHSSGPTRHGVHGGSGDSGSDSNEEAHD